MSTASEKARKPGIARLDVPVLTITTSGSSYGAQDAEGPGGRQIRFYFRAEGASDELARNMR
jgi:hypothetical protein